MAQECDFVKIFNTFRPAEKALERAFTHSIRKELFMVTIMLVIERFKLKSMVIESLWIVIGEIKNRLNDFS